MSNKNKLQRFAEMDTLPNVYQNPSVVEPHLINSEGEQVDMKGKWCSEHFKNNNPLVLELACGKGDYTRALAKDYPDKNFIGIDLKGNRLWKGATESLKENLTNVAFLRTQIQCLSNFFNPDEIDEIWITFPDPYLRLGKAGKRLTSPYYLNIYRKVIKKDGLLHLKTDNTPLYEYSLETTREENCDILYHNADIYAAPLEYPELAYKTYYEGLHLADGRKIKYLRWKFKI